MLEPLAPNSAAYGAPVIPLGASVPNGSVAWQHPASLRVSADG